MNTIICYVEELLYEHDFVVIPTFGGFVAGYQSSRITPEGNIYPPQKEIGFNTNVQYNDGLLVQTMMEKQGISFSQASALLYVHIEEWKKELYREKNLHFGNIGSFTLTNTNVISFTPAFTNDFLCSSFGFYPLYLPQLSQELVYNQAPVFVDTVRAFTPEPISWSNTVRYIVASAAVILFFLFFPVQLTNIPIDSQAGVCGYRFTSAVSGNLSVDENERVEVVDNQQYKDSCIQKVNTLTTLNGVQQLPERFYIVIGSFQTERMAQRFVSELPAIFSSATIVFSENRYRITTASFETEQEGEYFLHTFQQNHPRFKDAWLLKK